MNTDRDDSLGSGSEIESVAIVRLAFSPFRERHAYRSVSRYAVIWSSSSFVISITGIFEPALNASGL